MKCTQPSSYGRTFNEMKQRHVLDWQESSLSAITAQGTLKKGKTKVKTQPIFQEKIGVKLIRRYLINNDSKSILVKEIEGSYIQNKEAENVSELVGTQYAFLASLPQPFVKFLLPAGFPGSVSDDYLDYMIWQFPTNVTGWICSTLITSSLLKAVGINAGTGSIAAATASIKWVTKDGLGALGQLFIGGQFGSIFDEDPKQWRMYADLIGSGGGIFGLMTPLAPDYFLVLASLGNFTKAIAKGLKDPSFRVIQNHFAKVENVGEVAAKEEVWEVAGQLFGLALGVSLLGTPSVASSYPNLVISWVLIRSLHLWLRYQSLTVLKLATINYKRASILLQSHVKGLSIPGRVACNIAENLIWPWQWSTPCIRIGCSFRELLGPKLLATEVEALIDVYKNEQFLLAIHPNKLYGLEARVVFKEGASSITILQSMWQAYWLLLPDVPGSENCRDLVQLNLLSADKRADKVVENQKESLIKSLYRMKEMFDSFLFEVEEAGWEFSKLVVKIPSESPILSEIGLRK